MAPRVNNMAARWSWNIGERRLDYHRTNRFIYFRTVFCVLFFMAVIKIDPGWADPAQSVFYEAEYCEKSLKDTAAKRKYRDQWIKCIDMYLKAHRRNPQGAWAAAGLYRAGDLYSDLYKYSRREADRQAAIDLFDKLIRDYDQSVYSDKAKKAKAALPGTPVPTGTDAQDAANTKARRWYKKAREHYQRLQQKPSLKKYRDQWFLCIDAYRKAYREDEKGPLAAAALYGMGRCYQEMYPFSHLELDRIQSTKTFQALIRQFPSSAYAQKVKPMTASAPESKNTPGKKDGIAQVIAQTASTTQRQNPEAETVPNVSSQTPAMIEGLRFWSNPRYTRVVIDASQDTVFTYHELREDPSNGKPQRIYIDVHNSRLSRGLQKVVPINDNLLSDARAGQYTPDTVRVVVDINSFKTYKIFSLKNPFRIVLDVWGVESAQTAKSEAPKPPADKPANNKPHMTPGAIVKQLALGVRRIVIDPGHGGKDYGAPGYIKGVHEKYIVLQIGKKLAQMIRTELQCDVVMTRTDDTYLSLEERTAIANTQNADLFVSIHTNASPDKRAYGMETFILNLATDDEAILVAARENATSTKNISDLDSILQDLMQNAKVSESSRLAAYVQQAMVRQVSDKYKQIKNKGVKQAPFYVLLGAEMPSILVETAFISNPRECKRLQSKEYQEQLCRGIVSGIRRYIQETKPMAILDSAPVARTEGG